MQVTLTQQDETLTTDLDLGLVFWVEQNPVPHFDLADMRPDSGDSRPGESTTHLSSGGYDDPSVRASFTCLGVERHQDAIVQHPNRKLVVNLTLRGTHAENSI